MMILLSLTSCLKLKNGRPARYDPIARPPPAASARDAGRLPVKNRIVALKMFTSGSLVGVICDTDCLTAQG